MFIKFDIEKEERINIPIESYINKPVISNNHPIGVIMKATENGNNIIIEAEIWDKFVNTASEYFDNGNYYSMELNIK
jgi:hypothetical protein